MLNTSYHVLNGDALKSQFPTSILGHIIVARECLVDGPVKGDNLADFYANRAAFLFKHYGGNSVEDYFKKVVPEFEKMQGIPVGAEINLWFEDDLFCQVNAWFVLHLLHTTHRDNPVFLVRPKTHTQYGFGGLDKAALEAVYANKSLFTARDELAKLWTYYQADETVKLLQLAKELQDRYPFILPAVQAHIARIPSGDYPGKPSHTLIQLMEELKTKEFGPIFKEFCKRESIYGLGDIQVKRLYDSIIHK